MAHNFELLSKVRGINFDPNLIVPTVYCDLYENEELDNDYNIIELYKIAKSMINMHDKNEVNELKNRIVNLKKELKVELLLMIYSSLNSNKYLEVKSSNFISELAIKLLDINGGDMVVDFGCGSGAFLSRVYQYTLSKNYILKDLLGIDININFVNICKMILSALKSNEVNPIIMHQSILDEYVPPYNKAFSFPPFGIRKTFDDCKYYSKVVDYTFTNKNSFELNFIDKVVEHIMYNDRGVVIVPARILFNEIDREYINKLISKGILEGIIELPANSAEAVGVKLYVLVFSPNNKQVRLLDATSLVDDELFKIVEPKDNVDRIIKEYNSKTCMNKTIEDLLLIKNICPSNILLESQIRKDGIKLSEVAEVFLGCQYTSKNFKDSFVEYKSNYKILTSTDIVDGHVNWDSLQNIEYNDTKFNKYAVRKNDIVVTSKSSKVKTVVVDIEPKENILVTGGMIIVRPNIELLDPTFLKIFLDSKEGQLALQHIQKGATIISINAKDLANIIVPKVRLERQIDIARKYNDKLSTLIAYRREIEKLEKKLEYLYEEEMEVI